MKKYDFFKEWYYKELERSDSFQKDLNLPIFILTALISVFVYLVPNFYGEELNLDLTLDVVFIIFFILVTILICKIVFHIMRVYVGIIDSNKHSKSVIPYAEDINSYFSQVNSKKQKEQMVKYFIECIDYNTKSNDWKGLQSYKAKKYIVILAITLGVMSLIFILKNLEIVV